MKNIFLVSALLNIILLAGCQTTSDNSSGSSGSAAASANASKSSLIVEYNENGLNQRPTRYNTIDNEFDRFYYLEQNFETVFRKGLGDYDLDFQLYPASFTGDGTLLELSLLSMDSPSPLELELRMWVMLRQGDAKKDFGIIRTVIVPQRPMTQSSIDRDLNTLFTDAAKLVLEKISAEL